ncbi:hypothetical protein [Photobacterium carnosum]|uniref:hypothetical protein n=1 Tax=Photobacterium carnosum TaxID=2023717 RepID=UPI001E2EB139|nr:hypothetical protein [Photobacterium carnosum]MCD9516427.1 hypothetical protein [Photobacterium carnosum]
MSLTVSAKLHSSLGHLSEAVRSRYRAILKNPQLTFSIAIINMISLAFWGQEESLIILAIATGAYFSVRHQLLHRT